MSRNSRRVLGAAIASAALGCAVFASSASAFIYTTCQNGCNKISRYSTSGQSPTQNFITTANTPTGIAIDGRHVYWAMFSSTPGQSAIGRATLDKTGAVIPAETNQAMVTGLNQALGLAAYAKGDGTTYVYWVNAGTGTIGRVVFGPDGAIVGTPDANFITGATDAFGLTFADGVLWWTRWTDNDENAATTLSFIGRAEIDENGAVVDGTLNNSYLTGIESPNGITADSSHVYWGNNYNSAIGRATFDENGAVVGTPDNRWAEDGPVPNPDVFADPANQWQFKPGGLANDGSYLYWTGRDIAFWDARADDVGRRRLDDPQIMQASFFQPPGIAWGIVVQRDSTSAIDCPTNAGDVTCTLTVREVESPQPKTPTGQVEISSTASGGSYPDGNSCILEPAGTPGTATCTVTYSRSGTGGELMSALYTGSPEHAQSTNSSALLPVPVVIPPNPPGPDISGLPPAPVDDGKKSKKCKKKKSKKAKKKCKKKGKKS